MKAIKCIGLCYFVALIFMVCVSSCNNTLSVKGENGQVYESYQECCAAQDFAAAHQYLGKMESRIDGENRKRYEYESAKEYVFKQEALYLMSIGDETAKKRIMYLLKEEGAGESKLNHIAMLIDLAIENDEESFVKSLVVQLQTGDIKTFKDDFIKVIEYLSQKSDNNNEIISLINNLFVDGAKPQPGLVKYYDVDADSTSKYIKWVAVYNELCEKTLDIAISRGNIDLAKGVLKLIKEDIGTMKGGRSIKVKGKWYDKAPDGTLVDGNHAYVWFYNESKNKALKNYNEAVKSGSFKLKK